MSFPLAWAVLLAVVGSPPAIGAGGTAPVPNPGSTLAIGAVGAIGMTGWTEVGDGVAYRQEPDLDGELLRFDLRRVRASVVVPGPRRPLTAARARAEAGAGTLLAVNGGFFDTAGASLGLRIAGGNVVQGLRPRVDWGVLLLRQGAAAIIHSREYAPDPVHLGAIQVGPRLVVEGKVTPLKPQSARRTAVAVDRQGAVLLVAVTRARVDATVLAEKLAALGAWSALMLDGGPSTQLSFASARFSMEIAGGYGVPDLLLIGKR